MTGVGSRPARPDELHELWPAARSSRLFDSEEAFAAFASEQPWCVRVGAHGDAVVVERWRESQPVLAVRGLWAPDRRIAAWLGDLAAVAAERGYGTVLSPLLTLSALRPWLDAGMREVERLVGIQALPAGVRGVGSQEVTIERARPEDTEAIIAIDEASFDPFWRFTAGDLESAGRGERVAVARRGADILGYTLCTVGRGAGVLVRLAVEPGSRGQGVGTALLVDAARYVERAGAITLTLCTQESNVASRALYSAAGMTEVEEAYALAMIDVSGG